MYYNLQKCSCTCMCYIENGFPLLLSERSPNVQYQSTFLFPLKFVFAMNDKNRFSNKSPRSITNRFPYYPQICLHRINSVVLGNKLDNLLQNTPQQCNYRTSLRTERIRVKQYLYYLEK